MRGGGKFLRPGDGNAPFFDDDSSDDDSDDSGVNEENAAPVAKMNSNANLSSSDDDSDDDSDNDKPIKRSRSEDERVSSKASKKARSARSFFDEEAEASDDDEEEDDDDDDDELGTRRDPNDRVKKVYTQEDIRRENMDDEALELINRQNKRRQQLLKFTGDEDIADVAKRIEERHKMESRRVDRAVLDDVGIDEGNSNLATVTQQSLLPSVSDPSLWMFNCPNGKEQELVIQIMNKSIAYASQGKPLGITSAVAAQSKGRVYIESYSEPAVKEAVQGIRGLMQYSMKLVPISDMTTVMTVTSKSKPVKKNEWVRMVRGHYKGDLALVRSVRESGTKCVIQCVPRIDLTLSDLPPEEARIRRRTVRPPQKFFNTQEVAALGKYSLGRQRFPGLDLPCDFFEGNYYHDGYLLKDVTVGSMVKPCGEDQPPTLDELQRFRNRNRPNDQYDGEEDENEGSKIAKSFLDELSELQGKTSLGQESKNFGGLVIGDTVEIIEGDLIGMRGKLLSLDGSTVKVKPIDMNVRDTTEVEFLISQVRKYIPVGAHVKVIDGRYSNETGVVVAVESLEGEVDATAIILTDMTHKEVSVRISQLQESAEVASGQDKLAGYELHDLVVLSGGGSANEVGVIVRVGREEFTVINNHGLVREVRPEELRGKRNSSSGRAVALDMQGNQIRCGDTVSVSEGPHKGKSATIKRMSRAQLFLYSQTRTENAGIFVVRSRSCILMGNKLQVRSGTAGESPFSTPRSQQSLSMGGRGRNEDNLIGKTVRIQSGNYKGYLGIVSDATPTHVQVEVHSRLKKVMVLRDRVAVVGDKFGSTEDPSRMNVTATNVTSTPFIGGATPMYGGATPMHGGQTPMHGGATPSHGDLSAGFGSGNDDVWRPGGVIDKPEEHVEDVTTWAPEPSTAVPSGSNGTGGAWGISNENESTWTPSTNENSNSDLDPVPKQESDFGMSLRTVSDMGVSTMGDSGAAAPVWFMERVCIQLKKNDKFAVIKEVQNNTALVELEDKTSIRISSAECEMVPPKEHDSVLVTGGAEIGVEGDLVCIDGTDAILKDRKSVV